MKCILYLILIVINTLFVYFCDGLMMDIDRRWIKLQSIAPTTIIITYNYIYIYSFTCKFDKIYETILVDRYMSIAISRWIDLDIDPSIRRDIDDDGWRHG
jgi:hypothetical protein